MGGLFSRVIYEGFSLLSAVIFFVFVMSPISLLKKVSSLAVLAGALPLIFTEPASAFNLVFSDSPTNSLVERIDDLEVNLSSGAQSFDVTFTAGSFNAVFGAGASLSDFTFLNDADATAAANAISLALSTNLALSALNSGPGAGSRFDGFIIPYAVNSSSYSGVWDRFGDIQFDSVSNSIPGAVANRSFNPSFHSFARFSAPDAADVPTPALLPGLIGMGVAAIRKRRLAQAEDA
ncbi:MAG: PTPA-CTERM sorting domain-containing protein [Cyanobacteria bacterium P01_D01_bin.105]